MSRFHKKNKYDSDKEVSLKRSDIKAYSEDEDAFPIYIPTETSAIKKKKKKGKKIALALLLVFLLIIGGGAGAFIGLQRKGQQKLVSYDNVIIESIDEAVVENDGKTVIYNGKTTMEKNSDETSLKEMLVHAISSEEVARA